MVGQVSEKQIFEAIIAGKLGEERFEATAIFHHPGNTFIIVIDETTGNGGFIKRLEDLLTGKQLRMVHLNTSKKVCFVPMESQTCRSLLMSVRSAGVNITDARVRTWT